MHHVPHCYLPCAVVLAPAWRAACNLGRTCLHAPTPPLLRMCESPPRGDRTSLTDEEAGNRRRVVGGGACWSVLVLVLVRFSAIFVNHIYHHLRHLHDNSMQQPSHFSPPSSPFSLSSFSPHTRTQRLAARSLKHQWMEVKGQAGPNGS